MSEEEIIEILENLAVDKYIDERKLEEKDVEAIINIIVLYKQEKEKNKQIQEYAKWHIEHLTETISDYIDDDRKGNASIIGEFKEEREHWKDINRIINNEKTYIDYKNY